MRPTLHQPIVRFGGTCGQTDLIHTFNDPGPLCGRRGLVSARRLQITWAAVKRPALVYAYSPPCGRAGPKASNGQRLFCQRVAGHHEKTHRHRSQRWWTWWDYIHPMKRRRVAR